MKVERLIEPDRRFKEGATAYCKVGLGTSGPYGAAKEGHKDKIVLGVIGIKFIEKTRDWVELCNLCF